MNLRKRNRISTIAMQSPDTRVSVSNINERVHQLATRDRPPALDCSFGGSVLPALQEIAHTTLYELERLGISYRAGIRSVLVAMGSKAISTVSAEIEYADRVRDVASAEASQQIVRDRLEVAEPEAEFKGKSAKPVVFGFFLLLGGLTEALLTTPVATAMGLPGTEIKLMQIALGTVLTLGAVLSGWLAARAHHGSRDRRIVALLFAAALLSGLILVQGWLANIRGDVLAGTINSILQAASNGHTDVVTVSPDVAVKLFQNLGRVVVALGTVEGYLLHDPLSAAYRRTSRAVARSRTAVTRSRIAASVQNLEDTVNSASYQEYRAMWVAAAHSLQAAGYAAMSRYLGEVAARADADTRAALYEAKKPSIPLPSWVTTDQQDTERLPSQSNGQHALPMGF